MIYTTSVQVHISSELDTFHTEKRMGANRITYGALLFLPYFLILAPQPRPCPEIYITAYIFLLGTYTSRPLKEFICHISENGLSPS